MPIDKTQLIDYFFESNRSYAQSSFHNQIVFQLIDDNNFVIRSGPPSPAVQKDNDRRTVMRRRHAEAKARQVGKGEDDGL